MATCKNCNEVFNVNDMIDGYCEACCLQKLRANQSNTSIKNQNIINQKKKKKKKREMQEVISYDSGGALRGPQVIVAWIVIVGIIALTLFIVHGQ